jgi:hypothetical protein
MKALGSAMASSRVEAPLQLCWGRRLPLNYECGVVQNLSGEPC